MKKEKKNLLSRIGEFLFGKTIIIKNPFFGEMTDAGDYYECRRFFKPMGKVVEIGLAKKEKEPDKKQINFFNWIEENYDVIIQKISTPLEKQITKWIPNYKIQNFKKEFILEYLFIPKCETELVEWQISFYAENELQHHCFLEMKLSLIHI